jgi:hypothetical protein
MILPTKRLGIDRALLAVGGEIIRLLDEPKTVSRIWEELKRSRKAQSKRHSLSYDWFILALDLLYVIGAVQLYGGRIERLPR